ncbi:MAG: L,D-transpeptidase [Butyrivibrio sp.]|nr:L,D-transpeptidase [Butyrivibrio sp.]
MKRLIEILVVSLIIVAFSGGVKAADFDANYYAKKYPDVVNELGSDPAVLYDHYVNFGVNEGRFCSLQDEVDKYNHQLANPGGEVLAASIPSAPAAAYPTYIDVDVTAQVVTYYENNTVKLQTPCVTGNETLGRGTPRGTFYIRSKTPGKFLVGETWNVWVDRWMPFTESQCGFHDATWRSEFGGDIYLSNGSHGCVNLPHDAACQLYDMVAQDTLVVVR